VVFRGEGDALAAVSQPACPIVIARSAATKQSSFVAAETKLDCFASLAMTWKQRSLYPQAG
jgi:hypothetical protein